MIRLRNVSKIYGKQKALDCAVLHIKQGEFVFLVGTSGAGKSTLMRLIYREEVPTKGQVLVGGVDVAKLQDYKVHHLRRRMGIVFQDFKLLCDQTVFDNVAFIIRALGMSDREINRRVRGALKIVGLHEKADELPTCLSGGEQQRVGIARAIVNGPPLLIADEPTGNLDPQTSMEIMEILEQVNKRGTTVIVATHDHMIVNHMKKRVITLDQGKIVKDMDCGTYEC
ncbi:MAG: cell division ATP-binding protein FtsE [Candidatus Melainabacteria bacterium GWF2_37_15]|nr:MAG: cell division ATP-binding protein FtsE [Candidatus Melainabacteria bacterium GWF2_37_15]